VAARHGRIPSWKKGNTRHRWLTAIKDKALDSIPQHGRAGNAGGTLPEGLGERFGCTNITGRIHNFALDMSWLPWPVLPKKRWPVIKFKEKRGITQGRTSGIVAREQNPERKVFYQLAMATWGRVSVGHRLPRSREH